MKILFYLLILVPSLAVSEVTTPAVQFDGVAIFKVMGALVLVLILFIGGSRLLKSVGPLAGKGSNNLSVINGLSIGNREKVITVRFNDRILLLGVTSSQITLLQDVDANECFLNADQDSQRNNCFKESLKSFTGRS